MIRKLLIGLTLAAMVACAAETGAPSSDLGAAGGSGFHEVAGKVSALLVGMWTTKNSNSGSNMQSATVTNLNRGVVMGEPNVTWSCVAVASPVGAKCTAVGGPRVISVTGCTAVPGNPSAKDCVIKDNVSGTTVQVGTVRWSTPAGRWWSAQGSIVTPVLNQGFVISNTCSPSNESCWRNWVFNR